MKIRHRKWLFPKYSSIRFPELQPGENVRSQVYIHIWHLYITIGLLTISPRLTTTITVLKVVLTFPNAKRLRCPDQISHTHPLFWRIKVVGELARLQRSGDSECCASVKGSWVSLLASTHTLLKCCTNTWNHFQPKILKNTSSWIYQIHPFWIGKTSQDSTFASYFRLHVLQQGSTRTIIRR